MVRTNRPAGVIEEPASRTAGVCRRADESELRVQMGHPARDRRRVAVYRSRGRTEAVVKLLLLSVTLAAALTLVQGASPVPAPPGHARVACERQFGASACRALEYPAARRSLHVTPGCETACVAAYVVIARALPHDEGNVLARTILATPGFSWARLNNALGVPSTHDVEKQWRRFCRLAFTEDEPAVRACYRAILAHPMLTRSTAAQ